GLVDAIAERTGLDPAKNLYPSLVVAAAVAAMRLASARASTPGFAKDRRALITEAFESLAAGLPAAGA
ncbi:MAG: hypothetical protein ACM3S1_14730, partial [Hyphomicrobiales bacterium]